MTKQYNSRIKRKRQVAKSRRKKERIHEANSKQKTK